MKIVALVVVAAATASLSTQVSAQSLPTHSLHVVCKLDPDGKAPVHYSPIGKATIPWLPKGSSHPNTGAIISSAFRDVMVDRGITFYKAECYAGPDVKQVRAWMNRFARFEEPRLEIPADVLWPALVKWMLGMHRMHGANASHYAFEPVEPVSPGLKPSPLL